MGKNTTKARSSKNLPDKHVEDETFVIARRKRSALAATHSVGRISWLQILIMRKEINLLGTIDMDAKQLQHCGHLFCMPIALVDVFFLRPFYRSEIFWNPRLHHSVVYHKAHEIGNYQGVVLAHNLIININVLCFCFSYYVALMIVNHKLTGEWPYGVIDIINQRGVLRGWTPFLAFIISLCAFVISLLTFVSWFFFTTQ